MQSLLWLFTHLKPVSVKCVLFIRILPSFPVEIIAEFWRAINGEASYLNTYFETGTDSFY